MTPSHLDLERHDLDAVSDTEALASVLGGPRAAALARAARLLAQKGTLAEIGRMSFAEARALLGPGAATRLACALAVGRRAQAPLPPGKRLAGPEDVHGWARGRLAYLEHEELWLLALDARGSLRAARCLARGGAHGLSLAPKDVLVQGLRANARSVVLVHNHPSGDPSPSAEDARFTQEIAEAAALVGMPLLDHVVVARERFASVPFGPR